VGRTSLRRKRQNDFAPVMGIEEIVALLVDVIEGFRADTGQMIGIFGKWGRGKTRLLKLLIQTLDERAKTNGKSGVNYSKVEFHAWRYQQTPASWAYLYETIADAYLGNKKEYFRYYHNLLRLNFNRNKLWPLLTLLSLIVSALFALKYTGDKYNFTWPQWVASVSAFLAFATVLTNYFSKKLSTKAIQLVKKYTIRHSFKETLGLQAAIQDELVTLLKTWAHKDDIQVHKIMLQVEDLDRCTEEKIIENIDALRVMLDNPEIAERLIVVTAIDEQILKNAIRIKYQKIISSSQQKNHAAAQFTAEQINTLISEYIDKLFISAIKLADTNNNQRVEFLLELMAEMTIKVSRSVTPTADSQSQPQEENSASPQPLTTSSPIVPNPISPAAGPTASQTANIIADEFEPITEDERKMLIATVASWHGATPRNIIIFHYRFLLCKNALIQAYHQQHLYNLWQEEEVIKGLMKAIVFFTNLHDPNKISECKSQASMDMNKIKFQIAEDCVEIDRKDYLNMLEILEVFIAY
jgi:hypothetical protein